MYLTLRVWPQECGGGRRGGGGSVVSVGPDHHVEGLAPRDYSGSDDEGGGNGAQCS